MSKIPINQPLYRFIENRLFISVKKGFYIRVKQKLPDSINCVSELDKYDINFKKQLPIPNCIKLVNSIPKNNIK